MVKSWRAVSSRMPGAFGSGAAAGACAVEVGDHRQSTASVARSENRRVRMCGSGRIPGVKRQSRPVPIIVVATTFLPEGSMGNLVTKRIAPLALCLGLWTLAVFMRVQAADGPAAADSPQARSSAAAVVDYETQVKPLFESYCLECHSQDKRKGGLSLAAYGDVLDGGRSGAVIRPGNSPTSLITHRLTGQVGDRMPLDELPLSDAELGIIKQWIDQGARATPTSPA